MSFVLDNSVAMRWCFGDGKPSDLAYAEMVMDALSREPAKVPVIWNLEVANVLARAEQQGVIDDAHCSAFLATLRQLPIKIDVDGIPHTLSETLSLALRYRLSAYDASYLELALRENLSFATLDTDLRKAAKRAGIELFRAAP